MNQVGNAAPGRVPTLLAAGLAGAGVMTVELAAVRLLAPDFGSSTTVWTNVIGVVLTALALGYVLGARWSTRENAVGRLRLVLVTAGLWLLCLPFLAPVVGDALLPTKLALKDALPLVHWGSLAATILLLGPPIVVLGSAGPLAVELVQRSGVRHAGTAGGWVLGVSTIGSLLGTFATTHVFVPQLGLRATFVLAASLLIFASLVLRIRRSVVVAALVAVGVAAAAPSRLPSVGAGLELVDWLESPYQQVRVVSDAAGLRYLQVGEVSDSFQSAWQAEPGLLPDGFYYNDIALPLWWDPSQGDGEPRVLMVGLGAGSAFRVLRGASPPGVRVRAIGIEIDVGVVALARRHLELDHPDLEVIAGVDARAALAHLDGAFDLVHLDAYANQFQIPEHLSSIEFFESVVERLAPGGWIVANIGGFGLEDPVVEALGRTLATAVGSDVLALRVPGARNVTLFARSQRDWIHPQAPEFVPHEPRLARLAGTRRVTGAWRVLEPGGPVLTDDKSPMYALHVEALQRSTRVLEAARP